MTKQKTLHGSEREQFLDELQRRYETSPSRSQKWIYWRKKYSWVFVVEGTKLLKRFIDIAVSAFLIFLLSPIFILIALIIKVYDGGPIFYVTNRVGKWGKEFRFPKFRTMRTGADKHLEKLMAYNLQKDAKKFKIKQDPRVTPAGYFLRRTSLDELPQLWTVLKGDMSLVGPRPPLPHEVATYNLEERRRLDITPGLTGIWQVSGRSEIPFEKQVQLDLQYIESQSFWLDIKILLKTIPAVIFGRGAY